MQNKSRRNFLSSMSRNILVGAMLLFGIFNFLKRKRLEADGECRAIDACSGCRKYNGCEKPEKR